MNDLIKQLVDNNIIKVISKDNPKGWSLSAGGWSPIYINLREILNYPEIFKKIIYNLALKIKGYSSTLLGIPTMGTPIAAGMAYELSFPLAIIRQKPTGVHGIHKSIEGNVWDGVILIDDVCTTGKAFNDFRNNYPNVPVGRKLVVVDRTNGKIPYIESLIILTDIIEHLKNEYDSDTIYCLQQYNENPDYFKNSEQYWDCYKNI